MEDISRELEREIAQSRPKPHKQDRKSSIYIIDDFGEMKPGGYLKTLVKIFSFFGIVSCIIAAIVFYLYMGLYRDTALVKKRMIQAEKRAETLAREKEVLMARLVIAGKEPGIENETGLGDKTGLPKEGAGAKAVGTIPKKADSTGKDVNKALPVSDTEDTLSKTAGQNKIKSNGSSVSESSGDPLEKQVQKEVKRTISVEKFTVKKDGSSGDLLVRFDIRNISEKPGDVSGRIFTVLKPEGGQEDQWLVVPVSGIKGGIPSEYKRGQYFSIAHFKPVKFRIKNQADPDFFKRASIFIFNGKGDLIFEKLIAITEAE